MHTETVVVATEEENILHTSTSCLTGPEDMLMPLLPQFNESMGDQDIDGFIQMK